MTVKNAGRLAARVVRGTVLVSSATLITGCPPPNSQGPTPIPVAPMCTILCDVASSGTISWNGQVLVSDRTDPTTDHGFTAFRLMSGPKGSALIPFTSPTGLPDTYAISEVWRHGAGSPVVFRAQATPASRTISSGTDFFGSGWNVVAQNPIGAWSGSLGAGSANDGTFGEPPEMAARTVPQLMAVGLANPEVFGCAGARTQDNTGRTTWLIEATSSGTGGSVMFIQDLLVGDDRWQANMPGPTGSGAGKPVPSLSGPGNPMSDGSVKCVMSQVDDDLTTRQLQMFYINNGVLYHSSASNWGPITFPAGMNRFRSISSWAEVGPVLGGGFGDIVDVAAAPRPSAVDVFFVSHANNRYKIFHTARFSAGSWHPVEDVLALNKDFPTGSTSALRVAAGTCPKLGAAVFDVSTSEPLLAVLGLSPGVKVIRRVGTPQFWQAGVFGAYSPMRDVPMGALAPPLFLRDVAITARPFADNAVPPP